MNETLIAIAGYVASVLLGISLLVNNDLKFRITNTLGCLAFVVYGIMIHAFPIILTNTALLLINLYYLVKIFRTNEHIDLVEVQVTDQMVQKFLSFHQADVQAYFPGYTANAQPNSVSFMVVRDMVLANLFVATLQDDGTATVEINYTVPQYRDFKVGRFIFERENKYLLAKGIRQLVYQKVHNKQHESFLQVMGFKTVSTNGQLQYSKQLV